MWLLSGQQAWLGHSSRHNSPSLLLFPVWREIPAGLAALWLSPAREREPPARLRLFPLLWPLPQGQLVERVQLRFPPAPAPCGLTLLVPARLAMAMPPPPRPRLWLEPCESSFRLFGMAQEGASPGSCLRAQGIAVVSLPNYKPGVPKLSPPPPRCCSVVRVPAGTA